jgi:hypothetical protein
MIESISAWGGKTSLSISAGMPALAHRGGAPAHFATTPIEGVAQLEASKFDLIAVSSIGPAVLDAAALTLIIARLAPGGAAEIHEVVLAAPGGAPLGTSSRVSALRDADALRKAALFSGLTTTGAASAPAPLPAALVPTVTAALFPAVAASAADGSAQAADALTALGAQLAPRLAVATVSFTRPSFAAGASFSLKDRKMVATPAPPPVAAPPPAAASAWAALGSGGGAELMDEDSLLAEEDRAKKVAMTQMDCGVDNGTGKRKACKNCSCGLAELLENEDGNGEPVAPKSQCGSCGLGDAFRCEGCPHRGKPAFASSEEIKLAESMLKGELAQGSVGTAAVGKLAAAQPGGAVKLGLDDMDDF